MEHSQGRETCTRFGFLQSFIYQVFIYPAPTSAMVLALQPVYSMNVGKLFLFLGLQVPSLRKLRYPRRKERNLAGGKCIWKSLAYLVEFWKTIDTSHFHWELDGALTMLLLLMSKLGWPHRNLLEELITQVLSMEMVNCHVDGVTQDADFFTNVL